MFYSLAVDGGWVSDGVSDFVHFQLDIVVCAPLYEM